MITYIIHFCKPVNFYIRRQYGDCQHYFGQTNNLKRRLKSHYDGTGSVVTKKVKALKIKMKLGGTLPGDYERYLGENDIKQFCKYCRNY